MSKVGHRWDRCGHNSDAEQKFLFLRILWVNCDKIWHGLPLVIEQKHREKKLNCHGFGWRKMKL